MNQFWKFIPMEAFLLVSCLTLLNENLDDM